MKNNILYKLIGLALLLVIVAACETADQEVSPTVSPDGYPMVTFTPADTYSALTEGDTVVYTVTTDKMIARSMTFDAKILEGTLDEDDIEVIPGVLAPYTTSTTIKVIFLKDWDVEDTETVKFEFGAFSIADRYLQNQSVVNPTLDLTVANYVSDVVNGYFEWYTEFVVIDYVKDSVLAGWNWVVYDDTVEIDTDTGYEMDFDIGLSDATGFDINDVWSSDIWLGAFSGDNPEEIDIEGLPNGEYVIWSTLWYNYAPDDYSAIKDPTIKAPIVAYFERQGTDMAVEVTQPDSQAPTVDVGGEDADPPDYWEGVICNIIVADGMYTIKEVDGTTSGPWKASALRIPRPAKYDKTTVRRK